HLLATTGVSFGAHPAASFKAVSDSRLTAVVPVDVGTDAVGITVSNAAADVPSDASFTPLWPQPIVSSFTPATAKAGALVTIVGKNFLGETDVSFNGHSAAISGTPTDTRIVAIVPSNSDDTGHVTVTTQGTTPSGTSAGTFTFLAPPTISSFTPDGVCGAPITITGSDFTGTTSVLIGGASARFTVKSPTEIDTTVPTTASNTPQPISVTNAGGTTLSSTDFTLDWAQPVVSSFTPASARPGATVTIDGSSFTGANDVEFDGHAALNPKIVSDTKITAVVPLDVGTAAGAVSVDNPGGTAGTSATNFTPLWPQPVVSSFSPAKAAAGATVTITGKNLLGETNVAFNGHTASISGTPT